MELIQIKEIIEDIFLIIQTAIVTGVAYTTVLKATEDFKNDINDGKYESNDNTSGDPEQFAFIKWFGTTIACMITFGFTFFISNRG